MSDVSQGPGWWQASDNKWYPPESRPDAQAAPAGAGAVEPTAGASAMTPVPNRPWFKKKRFIISGAVLVLLIIVVAASGNDKTKTSVANSTSSGTTVKSSAAPKTTTTTVPPTTTTEAPTAPIVLSGTGQSATSSFAIQGGLAVFTATHNGSSNFVLELLNGKGESQDILVNEIGKYSGSTASGLSAGNYVLKIDADGAWKVTITQPHDDPGTPVPHTFTGKGQAFVGPFSTPGAVRIKATHDGDSNFVIEVLNAQGDSKDIPVNEIGHYDGSTVVSGLDGRYYLKIDADGNWTADVSSL